MSPDPSLSQLAADFGIVPTYWDLSGNQQPTSQETTLALLRANGLNLETEKDIQQAAKHLDAQAQTQLVPPEIVCSPDQAVRLTVPTGTEWRVALEGDTQTELAGRVEEILELPVLPFGLHILTLDTGASCQNVRLICAPRTAPKLPEVIGKERIWGINAALYGLNSAHMPGLGNYASLSEAGVSLAKQGADFVGINPVHAIGWNSPEIISPYSPTHRGFLNSFHIAVEKITPRSQTSADLISQWQNAAKTLATGHLVNYADHHEHHSRLLSALFNDFLQLSTVQQKKAFQTFCNEAGGELRRFAQFEHLTEQFGSDWSRWPMQVSEIQLAALDVSNQSDRPLIFHAWLQWIADQQLQEAQANCRKSGMSLGLYLDLAVGARRDGAEAWCESQSIAEGVSVGAPPDHLSPEGQNWNLAALAPKKLAADNYRTFRNILRQTMRHCGVIRIDHVLGLNRSYWIPDDGSPGGYIKQNFESLMALVRLEASRLNTIVVGEDLGVGRDGFRETMNEQNIYSYGVLQYEKDDHGNIKEPEQLRQKSLVCFGTHDTPTLAGFVQGKDIDWWHKLAWLDEAQAADLKEQRKAELVQILQLAGMDTANKPISFERLRDAVYGLLAGSDTAMVSVQLDDVFASVEAQNLPGTTNEHPNWQQKYPLNIEQFGTDGRLAAMAEIMRSKGRGATPPPLKRTK